MVGALTHCFKFNFFCHGCGEDSRGPEKHTITHFADAAQAPTLIAKAYLQLVPRVLHVISEHGGVQELVLSGME